MRLRASLKQVLVLILIVCFGHEAVAEINDESDLDSPEHPTYLVVLFPLQQQLKPPEAMEGRTGRLSDNGSIYVHAPTNTDELRDWYQLGLYKSNLTAPIGPRFDIESGVYELLERIGDASSWSIIDVVEHPFYDDSVYFDMRRIQAADEFPNTVASGVIYLEFVFMFSRQLDQLRVVVKAGVYDRHRRTGNPRKRLNVVYEYISPSRGAVLRPWREGEKEAIIESINARYEEKLARWPHNKKAYKKDRRSELKAIRKRDVIFENTAIEEGWSDESILEVLQGAIDHLTPFIASDLENFDVDRPRSTAAKSFEYINWYGMNVSRSGVVAARVDGQIVYRDDNGHIYSIPEAR